MSEGTFVRRIIWVVWIIIIAVGLVAGTARLLPVLLLVFTCWVLAVAIEVPVSWLQRAGVSRGVAVGLTFVGLVGSLALFSWLILPSLARQAVDIAEGFPSAVGEVLEGYDTWRQSTPLASRYLPEVSADLEESLRSGSAVEEGEQSSSAVDLLSSIAGEALPLLGNIGGFVGRTLGNLVLIIFITLFLVIDPMLYYGAIISLVPLKAEARALEIINSVRRDVQNWVGAFFLSTVITTALMWLMLGPIMRIPNAVALAVIAGIGTIVPTVGPAVALLPIVVFTLANAPGKVILTVILYAVIGAAQDRVLSPAIMKSHLNISPAAVLIFQLVAAVFFGFVGLLLAVPMLAILSTLVRELYINDALGKRDHAPTIIMTASGKLEAVQSEEQDSESQGKEVLHMSVVRADPHTKNEPIESS